MVVCAAVSPQLYILSYTEVQCLLPLQLMHSDFGGFSNGVYLVVKITVGENTLDVGILAQQTWRFGLSIVARNNKLLIMTLSLDSCRGLVVSFFCCACVESTAVQNAVSSLLLWQSVSWPAKIKHEKKYGGYIRRS